MAKATRDHDDEPDLPVAGESSDAADPETDESTDPASPETDESPTDAVSTDDSTDESIDDDKASVDDKAPVEETDDETDAKAGAARTAKPKTAATKAARSGKRSAGNTRRQRLAELEAKRKGEQRRRTLILVAICLVCAVALLAYPVYLFVDDVRLRNTPVDQIGVAAGAAGCLQVETNAATGNQEHVAAGTTVQYARLPPDSGPHYDTPAPFDTKFYTTADRPAVETLVHNLEHGYVVIWYRSTLSAREVKEIQAITKTFSGQTLQDKVVAAPWDPATDGGDFPAGTNLTLARWYADPAAPTDTSKQKGIRLSCAAVSGEVVAKFRTDYPTEAAPEPNGA